MTARNQRAAAVAGAGVAGFSALAAVGGTRPTPGALDSAAHAAIYDALGAHALRVVEAITWFGNNTTLIAGVVLVSLGLLVARRPTWVLRLLFASGLGAFVITGLKLLFSRPRPLEQIIQAHGWSFPSGHAFASTVFYGILVALVWRATDRAAIRWPVAIAGALLIVAVGLSRVYLNVHYLTDVGAGWLAGATWLVLSQWLAGAVLRQSRQTYSKRRNDAETSNPA